MAAAIVRSISRVRLTCAAASRRLFTSTISSPPPLPGLARSHISILRSAAPAICHSLCLISPCSVRFNSVRCWINTPGPPYSPRNSGSNLGEFQPELAPLFPGCDYEHWLIAMEKPGGEGATKQQMIDCYIQTLAKVLGSEEEAKKKIYNVSCERYYGFGCEIDEETSKKLHGLPGVFFVIPDTYVDAENKDYGGELFVNGEIVQRSPERQKRVEAVSHRSSRQTK